nr:MAG TPA: hypothetical protein [Caudoviricetes sp.]
MFSSCVLFLVEKLAVHILFTKFAACSVRNT